MPKFPGHAWPRKPLWGYVNEADPAVMEMEIEQATRHGVNVFIYDWYWYDRRPFLENCLNDGFLKAANNTKMKFYLMWANHDANYLWDRRLASTKCGTTTIWTGRVNRQDFEEMATRLVDKYFPLENYYRIDGKPVFMIYDLENLLKGLGGPENTRAKLEEFKQKCVDAGLGGLHLQLTQWGERVLNLSGVDGGTKPDSEIAPYLGFDSLTNYQFVHYIDIDREYADIAAEVPAYWEKWTEKYPIPYFPHISVGWDNNPRFQQFWPGVMRGNTPEAIEKGMRMAKEFIDTHELPAPLITVNSWNEWTETSYLEPDNLYGYGYLEAIRRVFKDDASEV
jgi:hypothetical protein